MTSDQLNAILVLRELLRSESESIRLSAAATILQFGEAVPQTIDGSGEVPPPPAGPAPPTPPNPIQDTIRAKRFELVTNEGKVLAILGEIPKHPWDNNLDGSGVPAFVGPFGPGVGLALLDGDGLPQIRLCADLNDGHHSYNGLTIYGIGGNYRVDVNASAGGGGFGVEARSGSRVDIGAGLSVPRIWLIDKDNKVRLGMALDAQTGDPGIGLVKADGSVLFKAPT